MCRARRLNTQVLTGEVQGEELHHHTHVHQILHRAENLRCRVFQRRFKLCQRHSASIMSSNTVERLRAAQCKHHVKSCHFQHGTLILKRRFKESRRAKTATRCTCTRVRAAASSSRAAEGASLHVKRKMRESNCALERLSPLSETSETRPCPPMSRSSFHANALPV